MIHPYAWIPIFLCLLSFSCRHVAPGTKESLLDRTKSIHDSALTVDTHIDWPSRQLGNPSFNPRERHEPGKRGSGQWDLPRMIEGGLDAVFMSIFTPQRERTEENTEKAMQRALDLIRITKKMVDDNPDLAEMADSPGDATRIQKNGKRAIYLGMENGFPIGTDLKNVEMFHDLGIRYITLAHTRNNDICDSSTDENGPEWNGLSPFGEQVVREMNRLGTMVDVSHISDDAFWDVIEITRVPVLASHSSARAVCDVPRNMNDEMLRAVKKNGGVVQLCILGSYIEKMAEDPLREAALDPLREKIAAWRAGKLEDDEANELRKRVNEINRKHPRPQPDLSAAIDHIDHMVKVMGIDHVGIGSDFDGGGGIRRINDVSEMGNITEELLRRGYSEKDIRKVWGGNLMRVFRQVARASKKT